MMSRREVRAVRLAADKRSHDVEPCCAFADGPHEGAADDAELAQVNVDGKSPAGPRSHGGPSRQTEVTRATTLAEIAALPIVEHPLRCFLAARAVPIEHAAAVIGVTRRTLARWFAWRARPNPRRAAEIARLLGYGGALNDDLRLFPQRPNDRDEGEAR